MKTTINCIHIHMDNTCPECEEKLDGTDNEIYFLPLTSLLEGGAPVCSCGTDFEWTGGVTVLP